MSYVYNCSVCRSFPCRCTSGPQFWRWATPAPPSPPQGWECPKCHVVHAWWVAHCRFCAPPEATRLWSPDAEPENA